MAPDQSLAFGLSIPDDGSGKLFFSLAVQTAYQWGAIGLGNDHMPGTLVLLAYANRAGTNVTFSPRLVAGRNAEPAPYADLQVELASGTVVANGTLMVRGVCSNCLSWPGGGAVDVRSTAQKAIYALGPEGSFSSDDPAAALKYHSAYGSFTMDMAAATGPAAAAGPPVLDQSDTKQSSGATLASGADGKKDWYSVFHALIMVFCFIGLMPLGILIIRLGEWARWHAFNQGLALLLVLVGAGLGFYISGLYNRVSFFFFLLFFSFFFHPTPDVESVSFSLSGEW